MSRVLVIDDDVGTLVGYKGVLRAAGHEVMTAALGEDGLAIAQRDEFEVIICDQRLPDRPGVEIVHQLRLSCPASAIVLVTGWGTSELIIKAKRAGATTYAEKPLIDADLISVVDEALRLQNLGRVVESDPVGHAARRWVDLVVRGAYLEDDPKTTLLWCRSIAVSHSTVQHRCDTVGVTPKASHDFVRLLRVVMQHAGEPWDLQRWLSIIDDRTIRALMKRAGVGPKWSSCVPNLEHFLAHQRLIVRSELIAALRQRLLRRPAL